MLTYINFVFQTPFIWSRLEEDHPHELPREKTRQKIPRFIVDQEKENALYKKDEQVQDNHHPNQQEEPQLRSEQRRLILLSREQAEGGKSLRLTK
jgi:hypothetical protein